jgi:hypothetical protein
MNKYRSAALILAACAAGMSAAACSSSSSSASSAASSPAASSAVTSAPPVTTGPAVAGRDLTVKGSLGTFPVPASAKIAENLVGGQSIVIVFGTTDPTDVSRFYSTALPKAGFSVSTNSMLSKGGDNGAYIIFTGHGYKGTIDSLDQFPGMSVAGIGSKDVTTIIFSPTK